MTCVWVVVTEWWDTFGNGGLYIEGVYRYEAEAITAAANLKGLLTSTHVEKWVVQ